MLHMKKHYTDMKARLALRDAINADVTVAQGALSVRRPNRIVNEQSNGNAEAAHSLAAKASAASTIDPMRIIVCPHPPP